jgi:hypothetical protein
MPHSQLDKGVIAFHRESDEWGVIITAVRKGDVQQVDAVVVAGQHSATFATCPFVNSRELRVLSTAHIDTGKRKKLLQNVIDQKLETISAGMHVLQAARTGGPINFLRSSGYCDTTALNVLKGIDAPVFHWLCKCSDGQDAAMKTLGLALHLWDKHALNKPSENQHEDAYLRRLMGK